MAPRPQQLLPLLGQKTLVGEKVEDLLAEHGGAGVGGAVSLTGGSVNTSYGEEFGNLIHHAYPGDDFYDLDSGVDAVIAKGYVDPEQLYVTGGSGGGVLTAWMIGHPTRIGRRWRSTRGSTGTASRPPPTRRPCP